MFIGSIFVLFLLRGSLGCFRVDSNETVYILTGSGFSKECQCEEDGFTVKDLKWLGPDNMEISLSGPGSVTTQEVENGLNIDITSISKTLSGNYKCITFVNGQRFSQNHNIHVFDPLVFINADEDQYLIENTNSMLYCEVVTDAPPVFTWYKIMDDGSEFQLREKDKYEIMNQGLLIKNVTTNDSGTFKCRVNVMSTGEDVDRSIAVKVMTAPKIFRINSIPGRSILIGEKLILECIADSTPYPEYSWNKTSETIGMTHSNWSKVENAIVIENIQAEDSGTYECYAHNLVGGVKKEITIEVLIPPVIFNFTNVTAVEDQTLQMACNATGYPIPNVTMMYFGTGIEQDEMELELQAVEILQNNMTKRIDRADEGFYMCKASNGVDSVTEEMYLTVYHKPYFDEPLETIWGWDGQIVKLSCNHASNPQAEINWRYQSNDILATTQVELIKILIEEMNVNQETNKILTINNSVYYGVYECSAQNNYGKATKTIHLKQMFPPLPIRNASLIEVTATTATFSIEGQVDGSNSRISGYTAEYDTEVNYLITNIHNNRTWSIDRPFKLENLKPNTAYKVSFVAVNEVGSGSKNGEFLEFFTLNKTVPDPPVWEFDGLELYLNDSQLLRWTEPENNGAPIDYYTLRYCPEHDEAQCKEIQTDKAEFGLVDLDENTTYHIGVIAHNSEGYSLPANTTIRTLELKVTMEPHVFMSGGVLIGISIVVVIVLILLLDLLFFFLRKQGIIATCCLRKKKTKTAENFQARDKKGLLRDNGESCDVLRPANGHKEFEYNKNTGVITGKHSAV